MTRITVKLPVSIVGVGRLGTALTLALRQAGYPFDALVSRRPARTKTKLASLDVPARVLALADLHLMESGILILTTPDDQIKSLVKLIASKTASERGVVLHTSGALSSDVLAPLVKRGWNIGSVHPLIAVGNSADTKVFSGAYWCIEGDRAAKTLARRLVLDLHGKPFSVTAENKPLYHAAAVMAAGNVVALFDMALELLQRCGIPRRSAQKILKPLTESAVRNISREPSAALTGPFVRGDRATVNLHLRALSDSSLAEILAVYRLLGRRSLRLAEKEGLAKTTAEAMLRLLKS